MILLRHSGGTCVSAGVPAWGMRATILPPSDPEQVALPAAMRAVALHELTDLALDLERDAAAVARAFVRHLETSRADLFYAPPRSAKRQAANARPLAAVRARWRRPQRMRSALGSAGETRPPSSAALTGWMTTSVNGTALASSTAAARHRRPPAMSHAAAAAAEPARARLACMSAARRYIGAKKRAAKSSPVSSAAGCCTRQMETA